MKILLRMMINVAKEITKPIARINASMMDFDLWGISRFSPNQLSRNLDSFVDARYTQTYNEDALKRATDFQTLKN